MGYLTQVNESTAPRPHRIWKRRRRAAQLQRIQERLKRLHRFGEHITTEVAAMR